ncbi:DUF3159 domain-containing protein [Klugiella xanthotipulae]|uniref:Uncharacterized protein DUF3159 n=1 Tax=Klugiella xanthotipulae TaxID=244735 RepID=A0A543HSD4_9MICO|nr:DUF3159 domain-containing protein [Klugiella xanthotipulae]TQM61174.1 uncharacterized protein DUF3159 [Klugiella xanthotipulae]
MTESHVPGSEPPESDSSSEELHAVTDASSARLGGLAASVSRAAAGEALSRDAVMESIGGTRGIIESVLPGLVFLVTYTFTRDLVMSVVAPLVIAVLAIVVRAVQRQAIVPAVSGLLGIVLCAVLSLLTGKPEDYYVPGFITNIAWGAGLLISVIVRWPLIGVGVAIARGQNMAWRKDRPVYRVMRLVTLLWCGLFAARLAVQLPLYYAGAFELLGAARLTMGVPFFALVIVVSWLLVRATIVSPDAEVNSDGE